MPLKGCESMLCNTAVFYDVENLTIPFKANVNKTLKLDEIYYRILELEETSEISVQRAYADWAIQINRNLRTYMLQLGIEAVQVFNTNQNDRVKNAADVSLIIDAVDLMIKQPEIENYVIVSGDGIFAFLAKKLHEHGKRVIGCAFEHNTNIVLKNACDVFISLDKTDQTLNSAIKNLYKGTLVENSIEPVEPAREERISVLSPPRYIPPTTPITPTAHTPVHTPAQTSTLVAAASKDLKIPNKLPNNKFSEGLVKADIPIWKKSNDLSGTLHIIKRMLNACLNDENDETELDISLFKIYVDHYIPSFRVKYYGFRRFGEFMRFFVTASPYCLIVAEETVLRLAYRGTPLNENDSVMDDIEGLVFTQIDGTKHTTLFNIADGVSFTFEVVNNLPSKFKTVAQKQGVYTSPLFKKTEEPKPVENVENVENAESAEKVEKVEKVEKAEKVTVKVEQKTLEEPKKAAEKATKKATETKKVAESKKETKKAAESKKATETKKAAESKTKADKLSDKPINSVAYLDETEMTFRKRMRNTFKELAKNNRISRKEAEQMLDANYTKEMFGIKNTIFKLLDEDGDLEEQRVENNRIKYWKDKFTFNGKVYLIYKEWTEIPHKVRFEAWIKELAYNKKI